MALGIKILGVIFGFFMSYFTFLCYKRGEFRRPQFLFWEFVWLVVILLPFFAPLLNSFMKELGFIRIIDFLMVISFMFLGFLTFYNYLNLHKLKRALESKIREEALDEFNKLK